MAEALLIPGRTSKQKATQRSPRKHCSQPIVCDSQVPSNRRRCVILPTHACPYYGAMHYSEGNRPQISHGPRPSTMDQSLPKRRLNRPHAEKPAGSKGGVPLKKSCGDGRDEPHASVGLLGASITVLAAHLHLCWSGQALREWREGGMRRRGERGRWRACRY